MKDERYESIYSRLRLLTNEQLENIINSKNMCYDNYNYDEDTDSYCPLATAFSIRDIVEKTELQPSQSLVRGILKVVAQEAFGSVKGLPGKFYTDNRESDIKNLCRFIIFERKEIDSAS